MEKLIIVSVKSYVIYIDVHSIIFQFTGLKLSSKDARKQTKSRSSEIIHNTKLFTRHPIFSTSLLHKGHSISLIPGKTSRLVKWTQNGPLQHLILMYSYRESNPWVCCQSQKGITSSYAGWETGSN